MAGDGLDEKAPPGASSCALGFNFGADVSLLTRTDAGT